jgi:tRNA threonylcarbamoyladenosine biosynthesis protein TsaB
MRLLAIETTGNLGSFAVVEGEDALSTKSLASTGRDIMGRHVEASVGMVREALALAGISPSDLDGVAVSLGPGSFTGLRVGLGIAKGICVGAGLPLVGVPTLDCLAWPLRDGERLIVPLRDAKRGEVYCAVYRSAGMDLPLEKLTPYMSIPPEAVPAAVDGVRGSGAELPVTLLGDGLARYAESLRSVAGAEYAPETCWDVKASVVGAIGAGLLAEGLTLDVDSAEPIYVRPSEAERKMRGG